MQKSIVDTLVTLLVERKGAEVRIDEIAKKLGISERTIFRFFKDKKSLHEAMDVHLFQYLQASTLKMNDLDFVGFSQNAYLVFDENENLMMAYLYSPFGHEARVLFRRKLNDLMIAKILQENKITMTPQRRRRLALIVSLVSAKVWNDIRSDFGFTGREMAEEVGWALKTLIAAL